MKQVHVECIPDELLVSKLGFHRKMITHHQGRSRIFFALSKVDNQLAMVDEDPESGRSNLEKSLKFIDEYEGIRHFADKLGNKICILQGKIEDWIINASKKQKINLSDFGLPEKAHDLHDVILHRLSKFESLIDELIKKKNPAILKLKEWLS
jgi:hypothetical protein